MIAINAITALKFMVVHLSVSIALRANATDKVVSRKAAASTDSDVPDFVGLARSAADAISSIISLSGRANSAAVSNQVVSLLALASSVDKLLIGVAGRGAEAKVEEITLIADTLLGNCTVSGMKRAGGA